MPRRACCAESAGPSWEHGRPGQAGLAEELGALSQQLGKWFLPRMQPAAAWLISSEESSQAVLSHRTRSCRSCAGKELGRFPHRAEPVRSTGSRVGRSPSLSAAAPWAHLSSCLSGLMCHLGKGAACFHPCPSRCMPRLCPLSVPELCGVLFCSQGWGLLRAVWHCSELALVRIRMAGAQPSRDGGLSLLSFCSVGRV